MLPDPWLSTCQADTHPTELPARQSQSLGWTKHFTSYKPKIIYPMMYFFFWGVGRVRGFMVLQNYFTYFELSQSLCWAKSKDPYGKKKHLHLPYTCIYKSNISSLSPSDFSLWFWKAPKFKSKVLIFRTTSLQVCCLPTQIFQAGLVGRKFFFAPCPSKRHYFKAKLFLHRSKFFFQNLRNYKKKVLGRGKMVGRSVDSKPNYFKGWPYTRW